MDKITKPFFRNNKVAISGVVISAPKLNHENHNEQFYITEISAKRMSGTEDIIPVIIPSIMLNSTGVKEGDYVDIKGQFRSYNLHEEEVSKLMLSVFAQELVICEESYNHDKNEIVLEGFVCKNTIFRTTPSGREVADTVLATHRAYGRSDYIPCICWGRNAMRLSNYDTGTLLRVIGRIQSRKFMKRINETESEQRVAYEVSISRMKEVKKETPLEERCD